jgi:hypothetical protein
MTDFNQQNETDLVNKALSKPKFGDPYDKPYITGLKLERDVILGDLVLNRIEDDSTKSTYKTIWVCTDVEGWWELPDPEIPDIPRGLDDGSYDVRGRWKARTINIKGTILPPSRTVAPAARQELIDALDIVYNGAWLRVKEDPMRTAYVRLVGRPVITSVNAKGRIDFSAQLKAGDPIKYGWNGSAVATTSAFIRSNVAYITTAAAHGFSTGNSIRVFDMGAPFDGTFSITSTGTRTFTYPKTAADTATTVVGYAMLAANYDGTNGYTTTSLTSAINAVNVTTSNVAVTNSGNTNVAVTISITGPMTGPAYIKNITTGQTIRVVKNLRDTSTTATVTHRARTAQVTTLTTSAAHKFMVGDVVTVADLVLGNGDKTITDTTTTSISYLDSGIAIASASLTSNLVTVNTVSAHGLSSTNSVYIYGLGAPFDGTYTITVTDSDTFTYAKTADNTDTVYEGYAILQFASTSDAASATLKNADTLEIDTYNTTVLYRGIPDAARSTLDADIDWIRLQPGSNTILIQKQAGTPAAASIKYKSGWIG